MRTFEFEALNLLVEDDGNHVWHRNGHKYKIQTTKAGYKQIQSRLNGSRHTYMIHRLVALAFIPNPDSKPDVNHIDGNKANNHFSNLEWVTKSENTQHSLKHLKIKPGRPITKNIRDEEIRFKHKQGLSRNDLSSMYGISKARIINIINGKRR